jgi:hypothetical protein
MNIKNRIRVITYNDDNHDTRVYVNGVYIGELSNPKIALELLKYGMCKGALTDELDVPVLKDIYIFDLKEEDEEWVHDLLSTADYLTDEEEEKIFNLEMTQ